ncbi:MAG TPA: NADH-quinone oxidoreductase subunit NuoH, partial [Acidimicrobiales bacterium]
MRYILALDPLVTAGVGAKQVLIVAIKVVVAFVVMLIAVIFMVWFERKLIAGFQNRIGPNKAGRWGILQTIADGLKLVTKEYIHPEQSDRMVFLLAPYLAVVPVFVTFSIVPLGGDFSNGNNGVVSILGEKTLLQVADPPIGILLMLAMSAISVYGAMLAGWSSGSKYPLLGSVRASAQMVSYEAGLGLSIATVLVVCGTLSTNGIVVAQDGIRNWNIIATGVVPFIVFFLAITAEMNRPPFDLTEAEQELVGGYQTEYSSMRFAMYYLAEFLAVVVMSTIIITLFLGGPRGLFDIPGIPNALEGTLWLVAKLFVFLFIYVWLRATLPRFRYDQLMDLGWKLLIPVAFGWLLLITALKVAQDEDWNRVLVVVIALA